MGFFVTFHPGMTFHPGVSSRDEIVPGNSSRDEIMYHHVNSNKKMMKKLFKEKKIWDKEKKNLSPRRESSAQQVSARPWVRLPSGTQIFFLCPTLVSCWIISSLFITELENWPSLLFTTRKWPDTEMNSSRDESHPGTKNSHVKRP